jgi:hypothetical protein
MQRTKAVKTGIACLIICCTVLVLFTVSEAVKLRALVRAVEQERRIAGSAVPTRAAELQRMERELSTLKEPDEDAAGGLFGYGIMPDISETAATVRRLLALRNIRPERFRITGNGNEAQAEFLFRCNPPRFFSFLAEAAEDGAVEITSVNIRPVTETVFEAGGISGLASPEIDVTMRTRSRIPVSGNAGLRTLNSVRIAQAFYIPRPSLRAADLLADAPAKSTLPEDRSDENNDDTVRHKNSITVVGTIRGADNREYVYGKDVESGRIVTIQNGAATPLFSSGGNQNEK